MVRYYYGLSVNDEYTSHFAVESNQEPICVNDENTHYLIVNGAKMFFDEDIWEVSEIAAEMYKLDWFLGLEDLEDNT